jgi:hypothetical protein
MTAENTETDAGVSLEQTTPAPPEGLLTFLNDTIGAGVEYLERDLDVLGQRYLQSNLRRFVALEALSRIAQAEMVRAAQEGRGEEPFDGVSFKGKVEVPWWAVRAAAMAWRDFQEQRHQDKTARLGRHFETEASASGQRRELWQDDKEWADRRFAQAVAWLRFKQGPELSLPAAFELVRGLPEYSMSDSSAWRAWSAFGAACEDRFRQLGGDTPAGTSSPAA